MGLRRGSHTDLRAHVMDRLMRRVIAALRRGPGSSWQKRSPFVSLALRTHVWLRCPALCQVILSPHLNADGLPLMSLIGCHVAAHRVNNLPRAVAMPTNSTDPSESERLVKTARLPLLVSQEPFLTCVTGGPAAAESTLHLPSKKATSDQNQHRESCAEDHLDSFSKQARRRPHKPSPSARGAAWSHAKTALIHECDILHQTPFGQDHHARDQNCTRERCHARTTHRADLTQVQANRVVSHSTASSCATSKAQSHGPVCHSHPEA
jgi:hypothetical protein